MAYNNEVIGLKLVSGEEIVGKVREEADYFVVDNPSFIIILQEGAGLVPWPQFSSGKQIKLNKHHVIVSFELNPNIVDGYNQKFGGIVTAPAGVLNQLNNRMR